jgi:hypothetical protein
VGSTQISNAVFSTRVLAAKAHRVGGSVCGVVWGFRWLWPLQLVPGWVVVSLVIWAGLELIVLLRHPHRWR